MIILGYKNKPQQISFKHDQIVESMAMHLHIDKLNQTNQHRNVMIRSFFKKLLWWYWKPVFIAAYHESYAVWCTLAVCSTNTAIILLKSGGAEIQSSHNSTADTEP